MEKKSGLFSQRLRPDNYSHAGQSPCFTMAFWPRWEEHPFQLGTQRKASVQHGWKRWKASHDKHMFKMFIHHFVLCKKTHIFFFTLLNPQKSLSSKMFYEQRFFWRKPHPDQTGFSKVPWEVTEVTGWCSQVSIHGDWMGITWKIPTLFWWNFPICFDDIVPMGLMEVSRIFWCGFPPWIMIFLYIYIYLMWISHVWWLHGKNTISHIETKEAPLVSSLKTRVKTSFLRIGHVKVILSPQWC